MTQEGLFATSKRKLVVDHEEVCKRLKLSLKEVDQGSDNHFNQEIQKVLDDPNQFDHLLRLLKSLENIALVINSTLHTADTVPVALSKMFCNDNVLGKAFLDYIQPYLVTNNLLEQDIMNAGQNIYLQLQIKLSEMEKNKVIM